MNLLERYVRVVGLQLPEDRRENVMAELSSLLQDQCDTKESELGRSLNETELANLLRDFGHPLRVASAYRDRQALIGPGLLPLYRISLLITLAVVLLIKGLGVAIVIMGYGETQIVQVRDLSQFILQILHSLVYAFGMVTLFFAALEYWGEDGRSWYKNWQPRHLVEFDAGPGFLVKRFGVALDMVFLISFGLVLNGFVTRGLWSWQRQPSLFSEVVTSPSLHWLLIPLNLVIILSLILGACLLLRGTWSRRTRYLHIALNVSALVILILLIRHPEPLTWAVDAATGPRFTAAVLASLNRSVHLALLVVAAILCYDSIRHAYQLWLVRRIQPK